MSSHNPPLTYKHVVAGLKSLGFKPREQKATSHEQWVKDVNGRRYKVTVDKPKSPFGPMLISSMANQAGVTKKDFYKACLGK